MIESKLKFYHVLKSDHFRYNLDVQWSETGDRYMLKLFRDYLFHQVDETGAPWIDMAHIVQCLNKVHTQLLHHFDDTLVHY